MRVTVVRSGNYVAVNGVQHIVDCSRLPGDFHVLQWYGNFGEIEHASVLGENGWSKKPNEHITDFTPYRSYVAAWDVADAQAKADQERLAQAAREAQAREAERAS